MDFFLATLFSLFSIVDPPGAIPAYVALTSDRPLPERKKIALHTSLYFLLILVSFFLAGNYILSFFGLTIHALRIAGGMTLLISGFGLMSGSFAKRRGYALLVAIAVIGGETIRDLQCDHILPPFLRS